MPGDLKAADAAVVTHRVIELHAVACGVAGHVVMGRHVTEIRRMRGGADVRGYRGFVDPDNVRPALGNQVVGDGRADDAADTDDDDICFLGKTGHE